MNIKVELDIFSGRPNPMWTLNPNESRELMTLLDSLPELDEKPNNDNALGYRGFLLMIEPESKSTSPYRVHVFRGLITVDTGAKKNYKDANGLEEWLFKEASSKGFGAIVDSL